ncbi:hypothetical protein [Thermaerobacillus caldiproteolyticus]|uniref:Uncharacterized protein n=1 Tax=Thermaerobacillus caldiproteolyticus TaxID=247480 RepID=A0A7W0BXS2_9BACL|nr:hypothetical protein [Anoxybacillus caldiproteolyticus]MBA2874298.1 hypothetical protein [Anoxybacillus caldiproteolyticus]
MFKIKLDVLKIDSGIMTDVIQISVGIAIISIIYRFVKEPEEFIFDETILNAFKFVFYGFLATYIYLVLKNNNFPKVDVITFLTFLLACFEATHNFIISIGKWIAVFLKLLFRGEL